MDGLLPRCGGALLLLLVSGGSVAESPPTVTLAALEQILFLPGYSAPATVLSRHRSQLAAETSGRVVELAVSVGQRVATGAPLLRLECRDSQLMRQQQQAAVAAAEARLELTERQLRRITSLRGEHNISEEQLNQSEFARRSAAAERESANAALALAQLAVERCTVTAPFAGIIVAQQVSEGEWVAPGQPLLQLLDDQRLEVQAAIPLSRIASLLAAPQLDLESEGERYPLTLHHLLAVIDPLGRQREARLRFSAERALPGSSGRLVWSTTTPHIPADWLVQREGVLGLFFVVQGSAQFYPLEGAIEGHPAAVEGLPGDTLVVRDGRQLLRHGQAVVSGTGAHGG